MDGYARKECLHAMPAAFLRRSLLVFAILLASGLPARGQDAANRIRERIVSTALGFRGVPYKYGSESPAAFDCSGFVRYVYRQAAGLELPRSARYYLKAGSSVAVADARPGDVFVFDTVGGTASHVALYAGGGKLVHAVSEGPRTGVIVTDLPDRYWSARLLSVRSFLDSSAPAPSAPSSPAASTPKEKPSAAVDETVADIGISIPASKTAVNDPVACVLGTSLAFTLTNDTGKAGDFIVQYYVIDAKTFALDELFRQKLRLAPGQSTGMPAYRFDKPGKYRLVVKGDWGSVLLERTFAVEARR